MKNCIIIPARLNSSRLPGKLLLKINNLSLIENVYNNCCKTKNTDVYIATDNIKIKRECLKFTKNIIMTDPLHNSGTDRVAEAAEKLKIYETIINVQGDELSVSNKNILLLIKALKDNTSTMVSLMTNLGKTEIDNPNTVKVIFNKLNYALDFKRNLNKNRAQLLSQNKHSDIFINKHIGVYGFNIKNLIRFKKLNMTDREKNEKLEQLRAIENNIPIKMFFVNLAKNNFSINNRSDYLKAKKYFEKNFKNN